MAITRFLVAGFCAWALVQGTASLAQTAPQPQTATAARTTPKPTTPKSAKPYFIEFRARSALSYGHTFAVYGRVGTKTNALQVAGLHPFSESSVPWMIGHSVRVPSETGASDGDTEDEYIIAQYECCDRSRIQNTDEQHQEAASQFPVWHAVLYNCNAFVADIAKSIGLKSPSSLQMPKELIDEMRQMNGNATVTVGQPRLSERQ